MNIFQDGYECIEKLRIFAGMYFDEKEDVLIYSYFKNTNNTVNIYTVILYYGKAFYDDFYKEFDLNDIRIDKKVKDAAVTKSFCNAAEKIKKINMPWGMMCGIRPAKMFRELYELGYGKKEVYEFLKNNYYTHDEKLTLAQEVCENELKLIKNNKKDRVSIYIGIPFCPTRCLYCSFVSTDIRVSGRYMKDFVECLLKEIEKTGEILKRLHMKTENIYIGGGTPTTLSVNDLKLIYCHLHKYIIMDELKEFTLEAGRPDTITEDKLEISKNYGVNRISINPQTMCDETLKRIGRSHNVKMIYDAFDIARKKGFNNINTDIIAGLPGEYPEIFYESIDKIIKLDPENITVHSMCKKRAADLNKRKIELMEAENMNLMLSYAQKRMKETSRHPYYMYRQKNMSGNLENVGYSKKGFESFYNINIMEEIQTIIALGGGGSTKLVNKNKIERIFNFKDPVEYIERFEDILKKKEEICDFF